MTRKTDATGEKQRELQRQQDAKDKAQAKGESQVKDKKAVQAGAQKEPAPPLPSPARWQKYGQRSGPAQVS